MAEMQVRIVSAEQQLFSGAATGVFARSTEGEIGILPGHQPVLLALDISTLRVHTSEGKVETFAVHGGFLEYREDQLTVLSDIAEQPGAIDVERARAARDRAQEHLRQADYEGDARAELRRAEARLRLADAG